MNRGQGRGVSGETAWGWGEFGIHKSKPILANPPSLSGSWRTIRPGLAVETSDRIAVASAIVLLFFNFFNVERSSARYRSDKRRFGFSDGTGAASMTGAPTAYCFYIHTPRASRTGRLSAPEHHRYVRFLDWKVARRLEKTALVE